jgi:hypothetical protein
MATKFTDKKKRTMKAAHMDHQLNQSITGLVTRRRDIIGELSRLQEDKAIAEIDLVILLVEHDMTDFFSVNWRKLERELL